MILQALYDYYQRHQDSLPSLGKELKEIGFILVLSDEGEFLYFEDRRTSDKKSADKFLVRKSVGRSSAPVANFLYDNSAYVMCYSEKPDPEKNYEVFIKKIQQTLEKAPDNVDLQRLAKYYSHNREEQLAKLQADPLWEEINGCLNKKYSFFSFRFSGEDMIVAEKDELISLDLDDNDHVSTDGLCLITGEKDRIVETTTATSIKGSQATAKLVSFQVNSGYDSYGKRQGGNAPIGKKAEFAYTTSLNKMLETDSKNKFHIGNRTFLFWTSSTDNVATDFESAVCDFLNSGIEADPQKVKDMFMSIYTGVKPISADDRFYILGLSPNSARIAVNYWAELPLKDFARNILQHFDDFKIIDNRKEKKPYENLRSILAAVTLGGKASDAIPNLPEAVVKSIFQGLPYPFQLYAAAIRRIKAEQEVGITRAAIIKAYINRIYNYHKKITDMLDTTCNYPGYLCGRWFAVIEKTQQDANNINTVKERYFNGASSTPAAVFPTLINLSQHHITKLDEGKHIFYEKLVSEIAELLPTDGFPTQLDLIEQGRFILGYYHQKAALYTSNKSKNENNQSTDN